ncbi:MAG: DUF4391 domain-containing protein [Desulfovibrio sp.]|nr:DUF4391 domain-containing protein [Desulfovibrio sp.]
MPEIQLFGLTLKGDSLKEEVLQCIDKAIPFPLLFELRRKGQVRYTAAYKRPSTADSAVWVVSGYFSNGWQPADSPRKSLPVVLNMECLYASLLEPLLPFEARPGEGLAEHILWIEVIQKLQAEIARYENEMIREKQFNKKIALNQTVRDLQTKLKVLA